MYVYLEVRAPASSEQSCGLPSSRTVAVPREDATIENAEGSCEQNDQQVTHTHTPNVKV